MIALQALVEAQGIEIMPITVPAISLITRMEHHRKDPFDRIIAATALTLGCSLVSGDVTLTSMGS